MTGIFNMDDDDEDLSTKLEKKLNLNYRLVDENGITAIDEDDINDTVGELPRPIPVKNTRRNSIPSTINPSSYEIDIQESYVSSLNNTNNFKNYKPKLSDFEPIKVLGRGAYGKVILVREISTNRLFAQKQLKKASLVINETNEIHQINYSRTINEKSILEIVNHPNIVSLYYAFQDNDKVYLILEYLSGGELFHHLAQEKFMSEKNASYYIAQIILALRYLHNKLGVIYRDLKPENCMLNSYGNLVLTDFGLSKVSTTDEKKHSMTGTVQYMAPEILKNEPYTYSVDWWSLGCVAYDLLTGSPPFNGNNNKKIIEKVISSKKTLKFPFYLSLDAKDLLRKLLQPNPYKRFNIDNDFDLLKKHRFFRHIDWSQLESPDYQLETLPPILPIITDPILAENFDEEFTEMSFTPPSNGSDRIHCAAGANQSDILHIKDFTFTNDSYLNSVFNV